MTILDIRCPYCNNHLGATVSIDKLDREIKADYSQVEKIIDKPWSGMNLKQPNPILEKTRIIKEKMQKRQQQAEFVGADLTLRAYHDKKKRKAEKLLDKDTKLIIEPEILKAINEANPGLSNEEIIKRVKESKKKSGMP